MTSKLVEQLIHGDLVSAKEEFQNVMTTILEQKLHERKRMIIADQYEPHEEILDERINNNVQRQGRTKLIRIRVRHGKIQRRKRLSAVKGYTLRSGRLTRMSQLERRHRKMGARRAKIKRRAERSQIRRNTVRSLRRRHALGL
jgi:hypothetical protein